MNRPTISAIKDHMPSETTTVSPICYSAWSAAENNFVPEANSDEALALRFAELHTNDLRYVASWNRWLIWTGNHWAFDDTLLAYDHSRAVCRQAAVECDGEPGQSAQLSSARTVNAVLTLARSDRRIAATADQWDADPWLLNTPGAVIDLRTGLARPNRPEDYLTKITAVSPNDIACERFTQFLDEITDGDVELQSYLQQAFGYSLTGETREHALFFAYGTGANGKSVLLSTIARIMGNYHRTASMETFTASHSDRHPTEIANLRGARLVTAIETEEGRRWAESRVRQLTGGDTISARFMRQDFFEFRPVFKLFMAGNHKPSLRSVDEAIRRRFHLIPFAVTIPAEKRDHELTERLQSEGPGILAWAIKGSAAWQRGGLQPPKPVRDATTRYLESEDAIGIWLDERCERDTNAWAGSSELFSAWKDWANNAGEFVGTQKYFVQQLETRGFLALRKSTGRGFSGLRLVSNWEVPEG